MLAFLFLLSLFTPAYALDAWDIPGTYEVTSEKPATFVIAMGKSGSMTVTMIGENSERVLEFHYDNLTGEARMGGNIGDEFFEDLMYIKFDFTGYIMRGEGYMRWGEKGAEKIPFTMVKNDGEAEKPWPRAGKIEVPRDKNGNPIDSGIRFSNISGEVSVRAGDDVLGWNFAELDEPMYHGDVLRLQRGAEVHLSLPDMTLFVLRGPAEIIVSLGPEKENKLLLLVGKVITNVKKMVKDGSLEVEMGQAIAGARGTTYVMEEDGTTSTLKVLEGTVSFKPNNGEELLITDGQMVSATDGVAGEVKNFSIDDELSDWSEETQDVFRAILAEAQQESGQEHVNNDISEEQNNNTKNSITVVAIAVLLIAGVLTIFITKRKK
jgi:hypothetical protein